ncbi:STAS-like domain-containing protein [Endozoicomonas sp. ISHI1]|uniref:STAS-like domain-containing protein n=1 Tax=Endozoicomonas sp. ISHI1 TaxID=2825882 RepID=UPI00214872EB
MINVVNDFHPRPFGRYKKTAEGRSGEEFRDDYLVKHLKQNQDVIVDLTGYNRYGPSFIDEAFGGLVRKYKFPVEFLRQHLVIKHDLLESVVALAWDRIEAAA